jgi:hypothetical protein
VPGGQGLGAGEQLIIQVERDLHVFMSKVYRFLYEIQPDAASHAGGLNDGDGRQGSHD